MPTLHEEIQKASGKISPQRYAQLMRSVELGHIILKEVRATLHRNTMEGENTFELNDEYNLDEQTDSLTSIKVVYTLKAKTGRKKAADVKVTYLVLLTTEEKLPAEFVTLYSAFSLQMQVYPYFRECVHSLFSKMGLPALVLPMRKILPQADTE